MYEVVIALCGVVTGASLVLLVGFLRRRTSEQLAQQLVEQAQAQRSADLDAVIVQLRDAFGALSREALSTNSEEFLKLAQTRLTQQTAQGENALEAKRKLIDNSVEALRTRLTELSTAISAVEKDRHESFGRLFREMENAGKTRSKLQETTEQLAAALASPSHRGQWGERMAEDVLRMAGMIEGINYRKQAATGSGTKPDFVFLLPSGPRVNMDVKFPLSNYMRFLEAEGSEAESLKRAFLRDVRDRVREVTTRDYIDPGAGTIDFVLVFIPNEQLYGFIHDNDPDLLEYAIARKVVLCSPITLFAILAIIRQAADNFRLRAASDEILQLLSAFAKQWEKYGEVVDQLGRSLDRAVKSYGELTTTRTRMLQRQVDRIEELRDHRMGALAGEQHSALPDGQKGGEEAEE